MTLQELFDWQMFAALEPFPSERIDLAGALIASTLANINRGKGRRAFTVEDFMLVQKNLEAGRPPPTVKEEADYMKSVILALGGKVS